MSDATGSPSYIYDPYGELTSANNGASKTTGYGYTAEGQLSSITSPLPASATWATSPTVTYNDDNADLLSSVTAFNGNQIIIGSTADSLPNSATLGTSGDTISTTYDDTDIPSAISLKNGTSTLQSFTYADSPAGTILNETDTPNSSQSPAVYDLRRQGARYLDDPRHGIHAELLLRRLVQPHHPADRRHRHIRQRWRTHLRYPLGHYDCLPLQRRPPQPSSHPSLHAYHLTPPQLPPSIHPLSR